MNYATLFKTIQGYLENDFPSFVGADSSGSGTATLTTKQQIDTFIKQAEQRIFNSVQFPYFRKNQTGTLTAGNKYLATPPGLNNDGDFLAVYELAVINPTTGDYEYLLDKDVSYIRAAYSNPSTQGVPKYYALFDENTLILGPTPAAAYTVELHYFYYPESITTANTTWLGNNFDSALLYGSLVEGYTYMKGEADVIANYMKRYEEAMILAKRLGDGMERRDAYRSGQVRMSVN
jgi:hypothetical protein